MAGGKLSAVLSTQLGAVAPPFLLSLKPCPSVALDSAREQEQLCASSSHHEEQSGLLAGPGHTVKMNL